MPSNQRKTILLVEDEFLLAMNEKSQLEKYGYVVITAISGEKAIELLNGLGHFDLILMDINLGKGMDGTEAAEIILKDHDIPIVFLSSHMEPEIVEKTEKITNYGYVVKSSSITVLDASIKMAFKLSEAKRTLKISNLRYERAQQIARIGSWAYNPIDNTFWGDDSGKALYGFDPAKDEFSSEEVMNCVVEKDYVNKAMVDLLAEDRPYNIKFKILKRGSGEERVIHSIAVKEKNGTVMGILRDVSEEDTIEKELKRSSSILNAVLEQAPVGISITDLDENPITYNRRLFEILQMTEEGLAKKEYLGRKYIKLDGSPILPTEFPSRKAIRENRTIESEKIGIVKEDKTVIWVKVSAAPLGEGKCIIITDDITEQTDNVNWGAQNKSEKRFKSLVHDMDVGVLIQGSKAEMLMSNPKALELLGLTEEQLLGKTSFDPDWNVIHEDGSPFPGETHPVPVAIATLAPVRDVVMGVYRPATNNRIWLKVDAIPRIEDGKLQYVVCTFVDISKRMQAEESLRESEVKFRNIFEYAEVGIFQSRIDGTGLVEANDRFLSIIGKTREQAINSPSSILWADPKEREWVLATLNEQGFVIDQECRLIGKGGKVVTCLTSFKLYPERGILEGSLIDISKQKSLEESLKKGEEQYRTLFEEHSAVKFIIDIETGAIVKANKAAAHYYGWPIEQLQKMSIAEINTQLAGNIRSAMQRVIKGKLNRYEALHRRADGAVRTVEVFPAVIEYEGRKSIHSIVFDINDRKASEERVQALLSEKDTLVREINHRVKNSMNVIESLLSLHLDRLQEPIAIKVVKDISGKVRSTRLLYEQLYQTGNFQAASIGSYLESIVREAVNVFPDSNDVKIEMNLDDFLLGVNEMSVIGIMINEMATNAMKYAFLNRSSGKIALTASKAGKHVQISIGDDGVGLPEGIGIGRSTGFGLTLLEGLTHQLGGSLRIERGNGTRFVLDLEVKE